MHICLVDAEEKNRKRGIILEQNESSNTLFYEKKKISRREGCLIKVIPTGVRAGREQTSDSLLSVLPTPTRPGCVQA